MNKIIFALTHSDVSSAMLIAVAESLIAYPTTKRSTCRALKEAIANLNEVGEKRGSNLTNFLVNQARYELAHRIDAYCYYPDIEQAIFDSGWKG